MASTIGGSSGEHASKTCTICGADVASKPRTKDARGRYYCKACYDQAIDQKHARRAATPPPKAAARPTASFGSSLLSDEPISLDDDEVGGRPSVLEQVINLEAPAAPPPMICPSCRSSIPAGAMLCTHCGYNMQTGSTLAAAHVQRAPKAGGGMWPTVIGIISIVFGGVGTIIYVISLIGVFAGGAEPGVEVPVARKIGQIGGAMLALSMALWLLMGGIGVLRRDSDAVSTLKRWAVVKLAFIGVCMLPVSILVAVTLGSAGASGNVPPELAALGSVIIAYMFLLAAWMAAWPIFLLVWFSRSSVQSDIRAWD